MTQPVTVFDADTVSACITRVLAAAVDCGGALVNTPDGWALPARQVGTSAGAAWDCEMLYAAVLTAQTGIPETLTGAAGGAAGPALTGVASFPPSNLTVWAFTVELGIVRKVTALPRPAARPTAAPAITSYDQDLAWLSADWAVLVNTAATVADGGWQPVPHTDTAMRTQGGMHGVAASFTVEAFPGALNYA